MSFRKIVNDPLHGFLTINDSLVFSLIEHPYFQRLRRIKQMALAYLVYPGATHTRLQHSLGAYYLMHNALQELKGKGVAITPEEEQATKIAILLHDIGHGPFSHALEETIVNCNHEAISLLIMQKLNVEFNGALDLAITIFTGKYHKKFLHQLVSSQLDVDRLDYLARDSFYSGVSEGIIGYDRILKMLTVHNNELAVEEKGILSIEKFLVSRRLMYLQVYLHKTVLSAENMLIQVLRRAKYLQQNGEEIFASPALLYFMQANYGASHFEQDANSLKQFMLLDDFDILGAIKVWCNHKDQVLSLLSSNLINRTLFKTIIAKTIDDTLMHNLKEQIKTKYKILGTDIDYFLVSNNTSNILYNENAESIKILYKNGIIKDLQDIDDTILNLDIAEAAKKQYVCYLA